MSLLITPSLLNSWKYYLNSSDEREESAFESFVNDLKRIPKEPNENMVKGIQLEDHVRHLCSGNEFKITEEPAKCVSEIATIVKGGAWQVKTYRDVTLDGVDFFLYGKVDVLKGPYAYDIKYTSKYEAGKFFDSYQHPLYLYCLEYVPYFVYLVSDWNNVWVEDYRHDEVINIENVVSDFFSWLYGDLKDIYMDKWESKK